MFVTIMLYHASLLLSLLVLRRGLALPVNGSLDPDRSFKLTATPARVNGNTAENITLRCEHNAGVQSTLVRIFNIAILKKSRSGWNMVADQRMGEENPRGGGDVTALGKITGPISSVFLEISWDTAKIESFGEFMCSIMGVDASSNFVTENSTAVDVHKVLLETEESLSVLQRNGVSVGEKVNQSETILNQTKNNLGQPETNQSQTKNTVTEIYTKVKEMEKKLDETERKLTNTLTKLNQTQKELKETQTELNHTKNKLKESQTKHNQTKNKANPTDRKVNQTEPKLNQTEDKLNQTDNKLNQTENKVNQTENNLNQTENKLNQTLNKLNRTENNLNQTEDKLNQTLNKLNQTENKLNHTENKLNQTMDKLNQTDDKLNGTENNLSQTDNKLNQTENKLNQTENKLNQTYNNLNQTEDKLNQTIDKLNQTDDKLNRTENKLNQTDNKLNQTENKLNQTENKLNQTLNKLNQTGNKLNHTEKKLNQTMDRLNQTDDELNRTENNLNQTDNKLNQTVNKLNHTENKLNQTMDRLNQNDDKLNRTENNLNQTDNKLNLTDNKLNQTENKLNQTDNKLNQTEDKLNPTLNKLNQTENKLNHTGNKVNQTEDPHGILSLIQRLLNFSTPSSLAQRRLVSVEAALKLSQTKLEQTENRLSTIETFLGSLTQWPGGFYALLQPKTGCPADLAFFGGANKFQKLHTQSRTVYSSAFSDLTYSYSSSKYFCNLEFCEASNQFNKASWPKGSYCIHKLRYESCPAGFTQGYVKLDTEDTDQEGDGRNNIAKEVLDPHLYYCCQESGNASTPIQLPTGSPFLLYRKGGVCQAVQGMRVSDENIRIDTEDDNNADKVFGSYPDVDRPGSMIRLLLCYYIKL